MFGEGITNDAVSIILFNTVVKFSQDTAESGESSDLTARNVGLIVKDFGSLGLKSISCGIFFGLAASYTLKSIRALTKSPVSECAMIFVFAYISYIAAELWAFSGIITLLTAAILMANYAWFNLSP